MNIRPSTLLCPALLLVISASQLCAAPVSRPQNQANFATFTGATAFNNATFDTEAMDNYLGTLRNPKGNFYGGQGQIDASGLTVNDPSYDSTLGLIHSRLMAWNPGPANGTISDSATPLLSGVDSKDMKCICAPEYSDPWNFYVRGSTVLGQGLSQGTISHFDANTESVTLGTDYRFTPHLLAGLTASYGHTDATLDDIGSSATIDSYSPGLYLSYADAGWYANFTGAYVHNAYTQSRNLRTPTGAITGFATSAPQGDEGVVNADGGYEFHQGALTFGPLAGLEYAHITVNGYTESGTPFASLVVGEQQTDSLRSRLGGEVSYTFSDAGLSFRPHLDAAWVHEFMDGSHGLQSRLVGGFGALTNQAVGNSSNDFALANLGLDIDVNQTITVFTDYAVQAGGETYFGQSVQAGVRVGF